MGGAHLLRVGLGVGLRVRIQVSCCASLTLTLTLTRTRTLTLALTRTRTRTLTRTLTLTPTRTQVRLGLVGPLRAVALQADVATATTDEVVAAAALGCEVAAGTAPLMDAAHACHDLFQRRMFQS